MIYVLAVAAIVAVDQFIKFWAVSSLQYAGSVEFIPGFVHLVYQENSGAAFGILQDMRPVFIVVTVIGLAAAAYVVSSGRLTHPLAVWPITMLAGGAVGNLIDRAFVGHVVDMFEFSFINFAVFNFADIFVTLGGALFCWYLLFVHEKQAGGGARRGARV